MNFAQRMKEFRLSQNLTQAQMANLIGYTVRPYQRLESGGGTPSFSTLVSIADHFDVSVDYLMGRTDNPKINR